MTASGWSADDDPRVAAGLEHLQRAAREVIAASRALLDVAEELVEDPRSAASVAELFGSFASRVPGAGRAAAATADGADHDGDEDPPVQRIPVS